MTTSFGINWFVLRAIHGLRNILLEHHERSWWSIIQILIGIWRNQRSNKNLFGVFSYVLIWPYLSQIDSSKPTMILQYIFNSFALSILGWSWCNHTALLIPINMSEMVQHLGHSFFTFRYWGGIIHVSKVVQNFAIDYNFFFIALQSVPISWCIRHSL